MLMTCARSSSSSVSIPRWWAGEHVARAGHVLGFEAILVGEGDEQRLIAHEVVEDAKQEIRLTRGRPDRFRPDAGDGQEPTEPLPVARDEAQRRDGHCRGGLRGVLLALLRVRLARAGKRHHGGPWFTKVIS